MPQTPRTTLILILVILPWALAAWPRPSLAADDAAADTTADDTAERSEDELAPGLLARYAAGDRTIERIDPDVQFDWGTSAPDARLSPDGFEARWEGLLNIKQEEAYVFYLWVQGEAQVRIGGELVVFGRQKTAGWISGREVLLDAKDLPIEIVFRKQEPNAQLKLFWSSKAFPLEPMMPQHFVHAARRRDLDQYERGRRQFDALRCNRCHRRENELLSPAAPSLAKLAPNVSAAWLTEWLLNAMTAPSHRTMPAYDFHKDEARAISAFLAASSSLEVAAKDAVAEKLSADERATLAREGETIFRSVGCLACHVHAGAAQADRARQDRATKAALPPVGNWGGDLTHIGRKRPLAWLTHWLRAPAELNADHQMPVFDLTVQERMRLALFLADPQKPELHSSDMLAPDKTMDIRLVAQGKKLVEQTHCGACHQIAGLEARLAQIPALGEPVKDWSRACVQPLPQDDTKERKGPEALRTLVNAVRPPVYRLHDEDLRALRAFVESRPGRLSNESSFDQGRRLLVQKGCTNCHTRDGQFGLGRIARRAAEALPDLAGQVETLFAPDLTAVGDKLHDAALDAAIAGKQPKPRLDWLRIRMPRFEHSPAQAAALRAYLIGHDRIPELPREMQSIVGRPDESVISADELRKAGALLAGNRGFSCVACHRVAKFQPRNVAIATRGSDLYLMGQRMRPEYFVRWVRSPLRIRPGMEMPSYERPFAGQLGRDLDGKIDRQLWALWEALNDSAGPPKIDTSTIEQLMIVAAGEPPRIIRDVFNLGDLNGNLQGARAVPRAFAVGFSNGHNLLFDLDTLSLAHWWVGNFAQQRASGKRWFWEPAVIQEAPEANQAPDVALVLKGNSPQNNLFHPLPEHGRFGRMTRYEQVDSAVHLHYTLDFRLDGAQATVEVRDVFSPLSSSRDSPATEGTTGWQRELSVERIPAGYEAVFTGLEAKSSDGQCGKSLRKLAPNPERGAGTARAVFRFERTTRREPAPAPAAQPAAPPAGVAAAPALQRVSSVPGYDGVRLPLPRSIMPTSIVRRNDGSLAFSSLKGQIYLAKDTDGDGIEDRLTLFEEGLAAPFGLLVDGDALLVAHKPELLRLRDRDGDGRCDFREVVADGWGYTDDYHDWTCGIVRDSRGRLYVGLGSDYAGPPRPIERARYRGKVLRIDTLGKITPIAHAFRYPTGLAMTADDQLFVTDNQGVQNTFNEINHIVEGANYGVPGQHDEKFAMPAQAPAIAVPHPWTRSVNGIFFVPGDTASFAGHGIGCEYDSRFLVRFSLQKVGATWQGAVYPFSRPLGTGVEEHFLGTLCGLAEPNGAITVGSFIDSGWLGGRNEGDLVRLVPNGKLPLGIHEIRAGAGRWKISFSGAVDPEAAGVAENYDISGYTRQWQGTYATPDSGRHKLVVKSVRVAADRRSVELTTDFQTPGFVYDIACGRIGPDANVALWPAIGHYTMNALPAAE
jgi:glucose/arabinose dehydrogenase/mono/diheme cytochrome c family protein